MKKLFAMLVPILLIVVTISGCTDNGDNGDTIFINVGDIIPNDMCYDGLQDKVIVFHRSTCTACKVTLPKLQLLEAQYTNISFEYIELDSEQGLARAKELKILPYGVPTVLINCVAYGVMNQDQYEDLILRT